MQFIIRFIIKTTSVPCAFLYHSPCKKRSRTGFAPPLLKSLQMASSAVCTINFHGTWSSGPQRTWWCMGVHFISQQVAVRKGKSSWNSWLIAGFSKHGTWVEAAASRHMLYWSTVAWPLKRNQYASRDSCTLEDEEDTGYETVDSPRSIASVVSLWCGAVAED